jgi:iron uptake system component EfeO
MALKEVRVRLDKSLGVWLTATAFLAAVWLLPDRVLGAGGAFGATQLVDVTGEIDPALQTQLDQAAATYKDQVAADIAAAVNNADRLSTALQDNDLDTARGAWIETRAAYERCKVISVKFPYLASGIDPKDTSRVGLRAIATKLFTPGAPPPLAQSQALSDKLHTFQKIFASEPVYAHGVISGLGYRARGLVDWLDKGVAWDKVAAGQTTIDGISTSDLQNELQGMEVAWNTVFAPTMANTDKGVGDRIAKEFADIKQLLAVASFDLVDSQALIRQLQALADSIADAVHAIGWLPPREEEAED